MENDYDKKENTSGIDCNIVHALKMGFVFAVLWCAIETGTFYYTSYNCFSFVCCWCLLCFCVSSTAI